jgi:thiamine pyrophosphokinase
LIVVGGAAPHPSIMSWLPACELVVAADSGFDHAVALGLRVDVLVGDLDSISPAGRTQAIDEGIRIEQHPSVKDATDAELAITAAVRAGCTHLVGLMATGDRPDHALGALGAFTSPALRAMTVELWWDRAQVLVLHGDAQCSLPTARRGELVTLLPIHGDAAGVTTHDLEYPLRSEVLPAGTSRGISNVVSGPEPWVSLDSGSLVVIRPHAAGGTA